MLLNRSRYLLNPKFDQAAEHKHNLHCFGHATAPAGSKLEYYFKATWDHRPPFINNRAIGGCKENNEEYLCEIL